MIEREWVALQINELLVVEYYAKPKLVSFVIGHSSFVISKGQRTKYK